jgi:hypothetical protein
MEAEGESLFMKSSIITAILFLVIISLGCDPNNSCSISVGEKGVSVTVVIPVVQNGKEVGKEVNTVSSNDGIVTVNTPSGVPCSSVQVTIVGSPLGPVTGK